MLQRLGIRGKILAVVAVPIVVLVLAALLVTGSAAQTFGTAQNSEELIDTLGQSRALEADLQEERLLSARFSDTIQDGEDKLDEAYDFTDTAVETVENAIAAVSTSGDDAVDMDTDAVLAEVEDAIQRTDSGYMESARAVQIEAPVEEGGWAVFPSEDAIASMQAEYASAVERLDALSDEVPADADLDIPLAALSFRLNFESESATTLFTEPQAIEPELEAVWDRVDAGVQALLGSSDRLAGNEANDRAVEALLSGQDAVANLPTTRATVRAANGNVSAMVNGYTSLIGTIVSAADDVAVAMTDRDLVSSVQAYGDLDALIENMRYEEVVVERLIRAGSFLPGEAATARTMVARTDISLEDAQESSAGVAGAAEVPGFGASANVVDGTATSFQSVRTQVLTGLDASLVGERDSNWDQEVDTEVAAYEPLRDEMWDTVTGEAATQTQSSLLQAILTGVAAIVIVVVSIVIALVIARRIIGPLRRLTTTATAVQQELPRLVERVALPGEEVDVTEVQIPVESRDEVGQLAEAFNGVNAATLSIAAEQAALRGSISEMFVNVARRDQVLLNRQLSSIDDMERTEDDPDTLTRLFALDHLATRMRRNSESLLVLAGIDTGRRLRRPMPLSDVIRTASSEIEMYERVDLQLDADPSMLGHTALTAAHLFAELLENATVFSDPGTRVTVRTMATDGGFVVEVEDHGIGMTESEVGEANARVGSTAASEILGEQRLGLFVVGRIARRVGAHVEVRSHEGRGTVATVALPAALFAGMAETDAAPAAPAAGVVSMATDEPLEAPAAPPAPRDIAAGPAYAPAAVEGGETLAGRGGSLPARGGSLPPQGAEPAPEPATAAPPADPHSIDALIAADAAAAPVGEPADPESLTEGTSGVGLPTRRRRDPQAASASDAAPGVTPVVGLPARATAEQLSALDAETDGGFMPSVSPSELAPQSADERASMFRGFRSRRETEEAAAQSESLGQAARREGVAADEVPDAEAETARAFVVPMLEGDDHSEALAHDESGHDPYADGEYQLPGSGLSAVSAASPFEPEDGSEPAREGGSTAAAAGAAGAVGAAAFFSSRGRVEAEQSAASAPEAAPEAPREPAGAEPTVPSFALEPDEDTGTAGFRLPKFDPATTGQFPAVRDEDSAAPVDEAAHEEQPDAPPAVPSLEDDEPADDSAPAQSAAAPMPTFLFEDDEAAEEATPVAADHTDWAAAPAAPTAPVAPSVEDDAAQASPPAAATAARDDSLPSWLGGAAAAGATADTATPSWARVAGPQMTEPVVPSEPTPAPAWQAQAPAPQAPVQPSPQHGEPVPAAGVEEVSLDESSVPQSVQTSSPASPASPQLDDLIQSAVEEDHRPGFFSRLFGRGRKDDAETVDPMAATPVPEAPRSTPVAFAPVSGSIPTATPTGAPVSAVSPEPANPGAAWAPPARQEPSAPVASTPWSPVAQAPSSPSAFVPEPPAYAPETDPTPASAPAEEVAPSRPSAFSPQSFSPEPAHEDRALAAFSPEQPAAAPAPEAYESAPSAFTAEQLAQAHGWEAAGQSALQAAQPEAATSYQPIIQPEQRDGEDTDVTSAVFSELSSLAAERPKVEKTRAGLQKRRASDAPPVEVKPLDEAVEVTPSERDADAVRHRFSAFYSGTQRARQDAEEFDRATQLEQDVHGGQD